ncbi:MAG: hypothetical protein V1919_01680 [Candidatus Omnitrophota bacterium]
MQDKMKFICIGLAAVIVIMLFFLLQSGQYVTKLKTDKDALNEKNSSLSAQINNLDKENKQIKEEFNTTKQSLEKVELEKVEAEKAFKSLTKEKAKLEAGIEELTAKSMEARGGASFSGGANISIEEVSSPTGDVYWAGILKKKAELEVRLETLRDEMNAAKLENEQLRREKDKLAMDMRSFEADHQDARREYIYNKKLANNLTSELSREKTDKFQTVEALKALKNENRFLKQQLKIIYDRKTKLEGKFIELQGKNSLLESNMAKMEAFVKEKIIQVDSLRDDLGIMPSSGSSSMSDSPSSSTKEKDFIELAPIVVRPQEETSLKTQGNKTVSVIAVNKNSNFVIVNAGSSSGVRVGDTFQLFRKDDPVAIVEVIQARENNSACDIKNENTPVAVGDIVR